MSFGMKNKKSIGKAIVALVIISSLSFLFFKTQTIDINQHDYFVNNIRQLRELDELFNQNILKSRYGYLANYDPIVRNINQIKIVQQRLYRKPAFINEKDAAKIDSNLAEYHHLIKRREILTEHFKSLNSILHNSLSYFPIAASEFAEKKLIRYNNVEISLLLNKLNRDVLIYSNNHNELLHQIYEQIDSLDGYANQIDKKNREELQRIVKHARTIIKYKSELDEITQQIIELPGISIIQKINTGYYVSYTRALKEANSYRLILYLFAIILISLIAYFIIRLRNTSEALQQANETLEIRVKERTNELLTANKKLEESHQQVTMKNTELAQQKEEIETQADYLQAANKLISKKNRMLKKQNQQIEKQRDALQKANATKDKFFSIVAHDLKNPFNTLFNHTRILLRDYENISKDSMYSLLKNIYQSTKSTYNLLQNLLEWSRTQTGRIEWKPEVFIIEQAIKENIALVESTADQKKIALKLQSEENHAVYADKNMINTVLRNLITNAVKFTHPGGEVVIIVKAIETQHKKWVEVNVSDDGIGISSENLKKLFRLDHNKNVLGTSNERGTGLGLIISKEFVERNGGTIQVLSKEKKGSSFIFTVTAALDYTQAKRYDAMDKTKSASGIAKTSLRVDETGDDNDFILEIDRFLHQPVLSDQAIQNFDVLSKHLKDKTNTLWELSQRRRGITDFKNLAEDILWLSKKYNFSFLISYGQQLMKSVNGFDIETMNTLVDKFPQILEKILLQANKYNQSLR